MEINQTRTLCASYSKIELTIELTGWLVDFMLEQIEKRTEKVMFTWGDLMQLSGPFWNWLFSNISQNLLW